MRYVLMVCLISTVLNMVRGLVYQSTNGPSIQGVQGVSVPGHWSHLSALLAACRSNIYFMFLQKNKVVLTRVSCWSTCRSLRKGGGISEKFSASDFANAGRSPITVVTVRRTIPAPSIMVRLLLFTSFSDWGLADVKDRLILKETKQVCTE